MLALSTFRAAAWLGWQTESNWASPGLFALYAVIRPVSAALLLVVMFLVVSGGRTSGEAFLFVFFGQVLFVWVTATVDAVGKALIEDREHWQTLRYVYLAPASPYVYLVGRGAARFVAATAGVVITLGVGVLFVGIRLDPAAIDYPMLVLGMALGALDIILLGVCVAALSLVVARNSWSMPEAIAAGLHILSGAIFPVEVLPGPLQALALALPLTYWLELMRRALADVSISLLFQPWPTAQVLLALAASSLGLLLFTSLLFRRCEHVARDNGWIDHTTDD
jgi:ABC-2 type transport system permease protein